MYKILSILMTKRKCAKKTEYNENKNRIALKSAVARKTNSEKAMRELLLHSHFCTFVLYVHALI